MSEMLFEKTEDGGIRAVRPLTNREKAIIKVEDAITDCFGAITSRDIEDPVFVAWLESLPMSQLGMLHASLRTVIEFLGLCPGEEESDE